MGGEGYALERAPSDTALAQLKSMENLARSDFPRRSPSDISDCSGRFGRDCMEMVALIRSTLVWKLNWPLLKLHPPLEKCVLSAQIVPLIS